MRIKSMKAFESHSSQDNMSSKNIYNAIDIQGNEIRGQNIDNICLNEDIKVLLKEDRTTCPSYQKVSPKWGSQTLHCLNPQKKAIKR